MIVALIPVKRLAEAKSRLAPRLEPEERARLVMHLLERTVAAVAGSHVVDRIAVVTPEPGLGESMGVLSLPDHGSLNASLREGASWALSVGASGAVVIPGDLAFIEAEDVRAVVPSPPAPLSSRGWKSQLPRAEAELRGPAESGRKGEGVAFVSIAPTEDGGTAALFLSPPDVIPPAFGPDSYARHLGLARECGVPAREIRREGLAFDLDTVEDLEVFERQLSPISGPHRP